MAARHKSTIRLVSKWLLALLMLALSGTALAGTKYYIYTDPQGTPLAKADAQGNIVERYEYTPYGVPVPSLGAASDGVGYTGHVNDPETGLVYMQQRYYDPAVGRFLSVDPVGPSTNNTFNFNRFSYVNNNPIVNADPDGTTCTRSGSSENYECHVDRNDGKFTDEQIHQVNEAYTDAVNKLRSNPNATVVVTVQGVSFEASAGDVARGLIGAMVVTSSKTSTARANTYGGGLGSSSNYRLDYQPATTIFKNAITADRGGGKSNIVPDLARTFVHEGIHMLPRENRLYDIYRRDPARFEIIHRREYNRAGNVLYGGSK